MSKERAQSIIDAIRSGQEHSYWKLRELALDAAYELNELLESQRPDWTPCAETTSEPTTGEIVNEITSKSTTHDIIVVLKMIVRYLESFTMDKMSRDVMSAAADRLESQEQKLELLNGGDFDVIDIPAALAYLESVEEILPHASALIDLIQSLKGTAIELTARAESAEAERDAAKADMKLIVDAVRETHCDETCCFACKFDCDTSINDSGEYGSECPGFNRDDCFEWRGQPQDGEGL